jgi:hypothetical protein
MRETIRVRLDIEINTDQGAEVRRLLSAPGLRRILLTELYFKFVTIGWAAGSPTSTVRLRLAEWPELAEPLAPPPITRLPERCPGFERTL